MSVRSLSFCVVSAGRRNELLELVLAGIRAQRVPEYEIVVAGRFREGPGYHYVPAPEAAAAGRIARLRNLAMERARYDHVVVLDDDILLAPGWYAALVRLPAFDVVTSQVRLPDGGRYWDFARRDSVGERLLESFESGTPIGPFGGGGWVLRRGIHASIPFDESLELGVFEGLEWSDRAREMSVRIVHHHDCVVWHAEPCCTTVGRSVQRRSAGRDFGWVRKALELATPCEILEAATEHVEIGQVGEAADCLRFGLEREPRATEFRDPLNQLERTFGGRLSDVRWSSAGDPAYRALVERYDGLRTTDQPTLATARVQREAAVCESPPTRLTSRAEFGVNLFGFISGNLGLGVAARNQLRLLLDSGIEVCPVDIEVCGGRARHDRTFAHLTVDLTTPTPHPVNVFVLNPSDLASLLRARPPAVRTEGRINVCIPFWELPLIPPCWVEPLESMDFIVAASHFIQYALLAGVGRARVRHIPQPVYIDARISPDRQRFGIPDDTLAFLCSFEVSSDINRKNPYGVIEAFWRAFPGGEPSVLVIKVNNPGTPGPHREHLERLYDLAARDARVVLIQEALTYHDVLTLYASADVYVSLHRAEGLGLGLLEAMSLGKPVIATAWSGNMEYMNERTGCLVGYQLVPVQAANQPAYLPEFTGPGAVWADPNLDEAAAWMRRLVHDPELRKKVGAAAAKAMVERRASISADELVAAVSNLLALRRADERSRSAEPETGHTRIARVQ